MNRVKNHSTILSLHPLKKGLYHRHLHLPVTLSQQNFSQSGKQLSYSTFFLTHLPMITSDEYYYTNLGLFLNANNTLFQV